MPMNEIHLSLFSIWNFPPRACECPNSQPGILHAYLIIHKMQENIWTGGSCTYILFFQACQITNIECCKEMKDKLESQDEFRFLTQFIRLFIIDSLKLLDYTTSKYITVV